MRNFLAILFGFIITTNALAQEAPGELTRLFSDQLVFCVGLSELSREMMYNYSIKNYSKERNIRATAINFEKKNGEKPDHETMSIIYQVAENIYQLDKIKENQLETFQTIIFEGCVESFLKKITSDE